MPATARRQVHTLGATYLAGMLDGNTKLVQQIIDDYGPVQLLQAITVQAAALVTALAAAQGQPAHTVMAGQLEAACLQDLLEDGPR